jgi:hypothetical protein
MKFRRLSPCPVLATYVHRVPQYRWIEGWVGHSASLNAVAKRKIPALARLEFQWSRPQTITILSYPILTPCRQNPIHKNQPPIPILSQLNPLHHQPIYQRSILIPSSHLRLGLLSGLFPLGFPTITLYTFLSSPTRATCPAHLIRLDFICLMTIWGWVQNRKLHIVQFTSLSCYFNPRRSKYTPQNLFSNTLSLCYSQVRDPHTHTHPYKTTAELWFCIF